jgi:phage terminase small subunit
VTEYYADLLDQYMCLWCNYRMLRENIEQRGVMVTYSNGAQKGMTDNKSVALKNQVHKQMLAIGDALGYREQMRVSKPGGDADNEPL